MSFPQTLAAVPDESTPSALRAPPPLKRGEDIREARLRAHIEKRLMSLDYLLARALGRLAAWYAGTDRLSLPDVNRAAIERTQELSVALLKVRVDALRSWRYALTKVPASRAVQTITKDFEVFSGRHGDPELQAQHHEANLALGAWDGPEDTLKLMEAPDNVA